MQPALLLIYSAVLQYTLSNPWLDRASDENHPCVGYFRLLPAHAYLQQVRVECGIMWKTSTLVFSSMTGYFTTHPCWQLEVELRIKWLSVRNLNFKIMKSTNFYVPGTTMRLIFIENWEDESEQKRKKSCSQICFLI